MLSYKIEAFLALLRAGLWENDVRLSQFGITDYNEVYRLAEEQAVMGLVAAGLERIQDEQPPKEILLRFVGQTLQLEHRNKAMNVFIASLVEKMRGVGIYTLLVKGQGIAQCYERPLWRACGDVDLFLSADNYEKAKKYLIPLASSIETEGVSGKHFGLTINDWIVELHGRLYTSLSNRINKVLDEIQIDVFYCGNVRSWINGNTQIFLISADGDVVYIFVHFLSHFYKGGVGLRQICDWCRLLWTYRRKINEKLLYERLKKMGLISEWKAFATFAVEYLGMPLESMPLYSADDKWKRKAKMICSFFLEVGNMGHNRDISYFKKYPYFVRKAISFGRICGDLIRHSRIFPLDSIRFFPSILFNGLRNAARGE